MEHSHGECEHGGALVMVTATANTPQSLPQLEHWCECVGEVKKMMAERWVSDSGQRCDSGARENAAALGNGDYGVTLRFIIAGARESEVREQNEASTGIACLISPRWPDCLG